ATDYLTGRGIAGPTIEKFGLGYAPPLSDGLLLYLRKKGFSDAEGVAAGLVIEGDRGLFDRFRDRLMIPIRDGKGRVIAFAGRAMRAGVPAKYMNSPRTELFDKGGTLFALEVAKPQIRRKSEAIIVEGQFDAISCHQAGLDNVVAAMGTALTVDQYRILSGLKIEKAVVAFDGDAAGTSSAEKRGRELALVVQRAAQVERARRGSVTGQTATGVYVSLLPAGTDPDELARRDPDGLRRVLAEATPVLAFVIEQVRARSDLVSPDGRRRFLSETLPLLGDEPDPLTRDIYVGTLSRLSGVPEEALREEVAGIRRQGRPSAVAGEPPSAATGEHARAGEREGNDVTERYLMAQLLQFPEEAARLDLAPTEIADPDHRAIYELLRAGERPGPRYPARLAAVAAALGASTPTPADEDHATRGIEMAAMRLRAENVRRRLGEVRAAMNRGSGDVGELMDELASLTERLAGLMRTREQDTVLREAREIEDE
ncbi:MAG: toprim domain-containing protein, partial [Chloroflexota bacterium]|nr:toprim domain-containing protein [Chloroflexota bacterium]